MTKFRLSTMGIAALLCWTTDATGVVAKDASLVLDRKIVLAGGEGRLDHFGLDSAQGHLLASNRSTNSLDIIDLNRGKLVKQVVGQNKISGIAYATPENRIFVANQQPGVCNVFDGLTYEHLKSFNIPGADNVQYDPRTGLVFVGHEGLTVVDAKALAVRAEIAMPAKLKAFRIDPSQPRLYANCTSTEVCVVDTEKLSVTARYPITSASGNAALAIDPVHRRLFVGCRNRPLLVVMDAEGGNEAAKVEIPGSVDDLSYDVQRQQIYASSGEGVVAIVKQSGDSDYKVVARVPTSSHAQTSIFDANADRLYVGVPGEHGQPPQVWVYQPRP